MLWDANIGTQKNRRIFNEQAGFWLAIAALGVLSSGIRISLGPAPIDDAFITFRYVENIHDGFGFVYNLGDRLLGTSTPLYTLLLASLRLLGVSDLASAAWLINSLADGISAILLALMAVRLTGSRIAAILVGLAWAVSVPSIVFARSGMETSLFVLAIAAAFYALLTDAPLWSAFFASLSVLVRPDGILVLFLAAGGAFVFHRRKIPWFALISGTVIVPWLAYSTAFFGNPIPHSALVKASGTILPELVLRRLFVDLPVTFFLGGAVRQLFGPLAVIIAGVLVFISAVCFLYLLVKSAKGQRVWLFVAAYPLLYVLALLVRQVYAFPWYLVPPLTVIFLGSISGAFRYRTILGLVVAGLLLAVNVGGLLVHGNFWMLDQAMSQRMNDYNQASAILDQWITSMDGEATVAVTEVGIIGYRLRPVSMLDMAGLVSDNRIPWENGVTPVEEQYPEFVAGMKSQLDTYIQQYPGLEHTLEKNYLLAWEHRNQRDQVVVVYCRMDLRSKCAVP